ncbi:hypothetical protein RYX36_029702 [Vicia faba]
MVWRDLVQSFQSAHGGDYSSGPHGIIEVYFKKRRYLCELLNGCPNLEEFEAKDLTLLYGCGFLGDKLQLGHHKSTINTTPSISQLHPKTDTTNNIFQPRKIHIEEEEAKKGKRRFENKEVIMEMKDGGADYCFECVGMASLVHEAYASCRKELHLDEFVTHEVEFKNINKAFHLLSKLLSEFSLFNMYMIWIQ